MRLGAERSWDEPGAFEVASGVYRIPLPLPGDGLRAVNVYAIETQSGLTLIDGGWALAESQQLLKAALAEIGYDVRDITRFLVTHLHRDHYTQAAVLSREIGVPIALGLGEQASLRMLLEPKGEADPTITRLREAGAPELAAHWAQVATWPPADSSVWRLPEEWLSSDTQITLPGRRLEAVATPGHTQGHYVFADLDEGLLFAGDHILPSITPSIGFEPVHAPHALADFLNSLAKVRNLPDLRLLPAHGPVKGSVHKRVGELLEHHATRLQMCLDVATAGFDTAFAVARELPWTRSMRSFAQLDVFNKALATMETSAHLEVLVARASLVSSCHEGVIRYTPTGP